MVDNITQESNNSDSSVQAAAAELVAESVENALAQAEAAELVDELITNASAQVAAEELAAESVENVLAAELVDKSIKKVLAQAKAAEPAAKQVEQEQRPSILSRFLSGVRSFFAFIFSPFTRLGDFMKKMVAGSSQRLPSVGLEEKSDEPPVEPRPACLLKIIGRRIRGSSTSNACQAGKGEDNTEKQAPSLRT